ncbi:MAG: zinc ribbon domain-containing protein [Clostridia bacterium]|nr:zinc ribbon domain-containing protein [Clostridia bacterium]
MALINCPECGKKVSDQAVACPDCGYPIAKANTKGTVLIKIGNVRERIQLQALLFVQR